MLKEKQYNKTFASFFYFFSQLLIWLKYESEKDSYLINENEVQHDPSR